MSYSLNGSSFATRFLFRLIGALAVGGIILTAMGMINLGKDAFGSHKNFAYMNASEFRIGDIVYGTIDETIGCAATSSSTRYSRYGEQVDSYYYVVPIYAGNEDPFPDKLILFRTAKPDIYHKLEDLLDNTVERYLNGGEKGRGIYIDRAEIQEMTSEEERVFREYVDSFVDAYYEYEGKAALEAARKAYSSAIVPYTVAYTESSAGGVILGIGLAMLGVLIVIVLVFIALSKRSSGSSEGSIYIGSRDPNLNAPTGLENASARYDGANAAKNTTTRLPKQVGSLRADYSTSHRPMPPIEGKPEPPRIIRYDPQTGRPVYAVPQPNERKIPDPPEAPAEMETIDLKNTDLVDTSNGGIDKSVETVSTVQSAQPDPFEMPAIDLKDRSFADLSNGGTDDDAWEARGNIAEMPMNGDIPVINPERYNSDAFFGTAEDMLPEKAEEPTVPEGAADILVQPTDPSQRNNLAQIAGGGGMNSVDLAAEIERDLSNGGVETVTAAVPEPKFPEAPAFPAFEEKPTFLTAEEKPSFPTEEEKPAFPETKQETTDSYNIFKTSGSDYNIFKDPKVADNHMGFPIEDRDQPSLDTSFPTADKK